jgi:hypothetical protein
LSTFRFHLSPRGHATEGSTMLKEAVFEWLVEKVLDKEVLA